VKDVQAQIDELSRRRQDLWAGDGDDAAEVGRIGRRLADLYEAKRISSAQDTGGRSRAEIVRQARVESELERLISR
jgi:hypothetical protein